MAQYWVVKEKRVLEKRPGYEVYEVVKYECRERSFVLRGKKIVPISGTRYDCTDWGDD